MIPKAAEMEFKRHAEAEHPREACGVVEDGRYVPLPNDAEDPTRGYYIPAEVLDRYNVQAILHSHPHTVGVDEHPQEYPSVEDMRSAVETAVPNGIVVAYKRGEGKPVAGRPFYWGTGVAEPKLVGRPFRHGVTDCYALIRDWYRREGLGDLPEFPRDWAWWKNGGDMYRICHAQAGFRAFRPGDKPRCGDVFLASLLAKGKANHGGIYLGHDLILHHPSDGAGYSPQSLSRRESASRWVNSTTFCGWLRYDPITRGAR